MKLFNKNVNNLKNENINVNENINKNDDNLEEDGLFKKMFNKVKVLFFIGNIFSLAIYTSYSLYVTYNTTKSSKFSHIILFLLISYAVAFLCLIIFGLKDKHKLQSNLKTYKSSVKILKQVVKLLNITISVITAINIFTSGGKLSLYNIMFGIASILIAFLSILFEFFKIFVRHKISKIKLKRQRQKEGTDYNLAEKQ